MRASSLPRITAPTWSQLGTGLPNVAIDQLFTNHDGGKIFVATHGRGMWVLTAPAMVVSPTTPITAKLLIGSAGSTYSKTITVTNNGTGTTPMNWSLDTTTNTPPSCLTISGDTSGALAAGTLDTVTVAVHTDVPGVCTFNLNFAADGVNPSLTIPLSVDVERLPHEVSKVTLKDSSSDAPAFWTAGQQPPSGSPLAVLAWIGTDKSHHLNIEKSADGLTYTNKIVLSDTAVSRPSLLVVNSNIVVISWIGTDTAHRINIMYDAYGARQKLTLSDTSPYTTSLAYYNGQVWLSWAGTDSHHTLNVMQLGPHGVTPGAKTTMHAYTSNASPRLFADPAGSQLLVTWTNLASPHHIEVSTSADGAVWTLPPNQPSPQTSGPAPDILAVSPKPDGGHTYFWSWAGTDSHHRLNLIYAETLDKWSFTVTFNESALGAPSLGYPGASGATLLAFTGTDSAHHINIVTIQN